MLKWPAVLLLLSFALVAPAKDVKAADFDGRWSVLVITEKGPCDPGYRYEVNVANGKVTFVGTEAVGMDGTVTPSGAVQVMVGRGGEHASGSGKLAAKAGSGSWRGGAGQNECAGRWEAERR